MNRSRILKPRNQRQWELTLPEIGKGRVVASKLPDDMLSKIAPLASGAIGGPGYQDAVKYRDDFATIVANTTLGDTVAGLHAQRLGPGAVSGRNEYLHTDVFTRKGKPAVPGLSLWLNWRGTADWVIYDAGTKDTDGIVELFTEIDNDHNARVHRPAEHTFSNLGGLVFSAGLQDPAIDADRNPALHGIFSRTLDRTCLLYTSPSPRDGATSRMPSSA